MMRHKSWFVVLAVLGCGMCPGGGVSGIGGRWLGYKKVPRAARREILLSFRRRNLPVNNR